MSVPTAHDVAIDGRAADAIHASRQRGTHNEWAFAPLEDVKESFRRHGLLDDAVVFRKGMVEDTLKLEPIPQQIAVLRLDTDWYESTLVELHVLYPRLSRGGILILDDYGSWLGSKRAVDEYFGGAPPLLIPIDRASRMAVKVN
jgi:O-methyltransferase